MIWPNHALEVTRLKFDNISESGTVRARQMIFNHSITSSYQPAMCAGLCGRVWHLTVTRRPWFADSRKESAVRPDAIVIG